MPFLVATVDQSKSTAWSDSPVTPDLNLDIESETGTSTEISPALFSRLVIDLSASYPTRQITGFQLGTFIAQRVPGYNSAQDAQAFGQILIDNGIIAKLGGQENVGAVLEVNSQDKDKKAVLRFKVKTNSWYILLFSLKRLKLASAMVARVIQDAGPENTDLVSTLTQDKESISRILDLYRMRLKDSDLCKERRNPKRHSFTIKHAAKQAAKVKCHYCRVRLDQSIVSCDMCGVLSHPECATSRDASDTAQSLCGWPIKLPPLIMQHIDELVPDAFDPKLVSEKSRPASKQLPVDSGASPSNIQKSLDDATGGDGVSARRSKHHRESAAGGERSKNHRESVARERSKNYRESVSGERSKHRRESVVGDESMTCRGESTASRENATPTIMRQRSARKRMEKNTEIDSLDESTEEMSVRNISTPLVKSSLSSPNKNSMSGPDDILDDEDILATLGISVPKPESLLSRQDSLRMNIPRTGSKSGSSSMSNETSDQHSRPPIAPLERKQSRRSDSFAKPITPSQTSTENLARLTRQSSLLADPRTRTSLASRTSRDDLNSRDTSPNPSRQTSVIQSQTPSTEKLITAATETPPPIRKSRTKTPARDLVSELRNVKTSSSTGPAESTSLTHGRARAPSFTQSTLQSAGLSFGVGLSTRSSTAGEGPKRKPSLAVMESTETDCEPPGWRKSVSPGCMTDATNVLLDGSFSAPSARGASKRVGGYGDGLEEEDF